MPKLNCPLRDSALRHPKATACLCDTNGEISYQTLDSAVERYAQSLKLQGLKAGECLAWLGENSLSLIIAILACLRQGAIIVPLNHRLPLPRQLSLINSVQANAVVCVDCREQDSLPKNIRLITPPTLPRNIVNTDPDKQHQHALQLNADIAMDLIFTSGSSGAPKAVAHSLRNHLANAAASQHLIPLQRSDRWLLSLPLAHIGGMAILFRCMQAAATIVLTEKSDMADAIAQHQVSHVSLVNTQLYRLLKKSDRTSLGQLKYLLLGGSAIDSSLLDHAKQQGLNCFTSYGMTEMSSQISTGPALGDNIVGQPLSGVQLQLTPEGEVEVKGDTLALGYWNERDIDSLSNTQGWFATGDIAEQTPQGLRLIGRKDNRFVCAGENIQAEQIEQCLLSHPQINQAVIVPVPDIEWGEIAAAFTPPLSGDVLTSAKDLIQRQLGSLYQPKQWLVLPDSHADTKPDRPALKEMAIASIKNSYHQSSMDTK